MASIEVLNGPEVGKKTSITQETFFLGRDENNHLVLSDRTVSRRHAVINHVEDQFIISDLKSLKGLLVNGSKMGESILEDGDEIALGAVRVRFFLEEGKPFSFPAKKKSRLPLAGWVGALLVILFLGGTVYYFMAPLPGLRLPSPPWGKGEAEGATIAQHYKRGIELFNLLHDTQGAKREWQKVLEIDPKKTTIFAQKAAKLLETVGEE